MKSTLVVSSALFFAAVAAAQPYVISTLTGGVLPPTSGPRGGLADREPSERCGGRGGQRLLLKSQFRF